MPGRIQKKRSVRGHNGGRKGTRHVISRNKSADNSGAAKLPKDARSQAELLHGSANANKQEEDKASAKRKRKASADEQNDNGAVDSEQRPAKKAKITVTAESPSQKIKDEPAASAAAAAAAVEPAVINQAPTKVLTVLVFGAGECGELGLGPRKKASLQPRVNPFLNALDPDKFHAVQVACGGMHTLVLTADNKIVSWGVNDNDALGRDTRWDGGMRDADASEDDEDDEELNPHESTPGEVPAGLFPGGTKFVQVAAGDSCSFALTDTGLVYGWGTFLDSQGRARFRLDDKGELIEKQSTPMLIPDLEKITQIACGANHALAVDNSGAVWGWGSNEQNQLGRPFSGTHEDTLAPGRLDICRRKVKYVASGEYHAFAIDVKDRVYGWGLNSFGEAGDAKTAGGDAAVLPRPVKIRDLCNRGITVIDGGAHHSAAVTADGQCLVWGRLDGGQLGIRFTPEQLQDETHVRYDEYKKPRICLRPTPVANVGKVVHVACGTDHTIFVNEEGQGYATGFGSSGQLGLGDDDDKEVAQRMGGKKMEERELLWAGAGGQFSVVAASVKAA